MRNAESDAISKPTDAENARLSEAEGNIGEPGRDGDLCPAGYGAAGLHCVQWL
jgi:hypothetical protein